MSRDFLPPRSNETDGERRLREAINRQCQALLNTLDAAIELRTAPGEAARARHLARGDLLGFALKAMHAHAIRADTTEDSTTEETADDTQGTQDRRGDGSRHRA